jgi:hypothetical protein
MIPQRIIQTGKNNKLNIKQKSAVTTLKLLNPNFEYVFFDDTQVLEFITTNFPEYVPAFNSFRYPIQKYDFFRYLAVYKLGGFYLDLDVFLSAPLKPLSRYECVFPFEVPTSSQFLRKECGINWEIGNYAFGARAGHPFLRAVINNCVRAQENPEWVNRTQRGIPFFVKESFYILHSTGPGLITRTFAEYEDPYGSIKVLLPKDAGDPENWFKFGRFGFHLMEGNWRGKRGPFARWAERVWKEHARSISLSSFIPSEEIRLVPLEQRNSLRDKVPKEGSC